MSDVYQQIEVKVARHVFGAWLLRAQKVAKPAEFLVEQIKAQGVGSVLQDEFAPVHAWSLSGDTFRVLDAEYRTIWVRHIAYMADAALAKNFQMTLL